MRVHDDRVGVRDRQPRRGGHPAAGRVVVGHEPEEAAVRRVHVHPHAVLAAQRQGQVDPVHGAEPGGAGGEHDSADLARRAAGRPGRPGPSGRRRRSAPRRDGRRAGGTSGRACSGRRRCTRPRGPGASRARRTAPPGWRRCRRTRGGRGGQGSPNIAASSAVTSFSICAVAGPAVQGVVVRVDLHRREVAQDGDRVRAASPSGRRTWGARRGSCRASARRARRPRRRGGRGPRRGLGGAGRARTTRARSGARRPRGPASPPGPATGPCRAG